MIKLTFAEVVHGLGGRPRGDLPAVSIGGVSTDSRTVTARDLFFALRGPRFDGHDFVVDALRRGAIAAVVEQRRAAALEAELVAAGLARTPAALLIEVDDTGAALGRLAAYHRRLSGAQVIGVVGSNGKTTTKAMIHHILSGRLRGRCSPASFNNSVGVPLTLLSAEVGDEYLVVEIGTNHRGEIAALGAIAQPDLVVLTCLGEEHLEGLGSLEGVAEEECSIFAHLSPGGFAAVNIDHPIVQRYLPTSGAHVVTFGHSPQADVRLTVLGYEKPWLRFTLNERFPFRLRLPGAHNALNAAAAVTVARRFGLDYAEAAVRLESFVLPPMRNEVIQVAGVTIINDAYNANPQSATAAIETLEQMPCAGRRILVFGEMRELGSQSAEMHRRIARRLRDSSVQRVILVGPATGPMQEVLADDGLFGPSVESCPDVPACLERLAATVHPGDVVLLKASRAVALDRLVEPLRERLTGAPVN